MSLWVVDLVVMALALVVEVVCAGGGEGGEIRSEKGGGGWRHIWREKAA